MVKLSFAEVRKSAREFSYGLDFKSCYSVLRHFRTGTCGLGFTFTVHFKVNLGHSFTPNNQLTERILSWIQKGNKIKDGDL